MSLFRRRAATIEPKPLPPVHRVSWQGRTGNPGGYADCATADEANLVCDGLLKLRLAAVVWNATPPERAAREEQTA